MLTVYFFCQNHNNTVIRGCIRTNHCNGILQHLRKFFQPCFAHVMICVFCSIDDVINVSLVDCHWQITKPDFSI